MGILTVDLSGNSYDTLVVDHRSARILQQLYKIDETDLNLLKMAGSFMLPQVEEIVFNWYSWLETQPEFEQFFSDKRILHHVRQKQHDYWQEFLAGEISEGYVQRRRIIGETHARIGLSMTVFFAGMSIFDQLFSEMMQKQSLSENEQMQMSDAIAKQIHLDTGIVCEMFNYVMNELISGQSKALLEMSTPVTEIWQGILLLPVVGIVDSKRSQDIMNAVLQMIAKTRAKEFILDISGVAVVDTAVANYLIKITKATRLMGCE
ncbi:MAG: protoglobin domain-containing protein, partial [Xenococcaceae cyanobacterium MO_167.B52]|nr:protoglobin domain-containing protein [Xenococcaceae cyanobacterium MO_167.B52]